MGGRDVVFGHSNLSDDRASVADEVEQRLDGQSAVDCFDTMTVVLQGDAIALACYSGPTSGGVAESLPIPLPTVKIRIRDRLERMENCLIGGETR